MPTIITHAIVGISGSAVLSKRSDYTKVLILSIICTILPDVDVLGFRLGIGYGDFLGHRGFAHSLIFALFVGFIVTAIFFRTKKLLTKDWWKLFIYFSLTTGTHGVLDAFTNGGLGIALFSPINTKRFFFWITPISVSPINPQKFFTTNGLKIIGNELLLVWLPSLAFVMVVKVIGKFTISKQRSQALDN